MASVQAIPRPDTEANHKRTTSSVLKSFIHKRTPSRGTVLPSAFSDIHIATPLRPLDHPHSRALGEIPSNHRSQACPPPSKSTDDDGQNAIGEKVNFLSKKTKSTISLKSLTGRDTEKTDTAKNESPRKPKKTKSSTNLASLLSRPRSSKNLKKPAAREDVRSEKDKENQMPAELSLLENSSRPPIYAQFSSERFTTQPLGGKFLEDEIDLYTPQEYSPGKQRNFHGGPRSQPTLGQSDKSRRPVSTYLPSSFSIKDIHTQISGNARRSAENPRRASLDIRNRSEGKESGREKKSNFVAAQKETKAIAAIAALGVTERVQQDIPGTVDITDVDMDFEAMLDRRNIPENQRYKMRSLALSVKKDFIRQDWAETAVQSGRPRTRDSDENADDVLRRVNGLDVKTKRPRSRTFTLSKSSKESISPTKKPRPESTHGGHARTKSDESISSYGKTLALTSTGASVASTLIAKAKGQLPDDFVLYLRKVPKPELVEVGKLHKLRLLLRNETVAWTDEFIGLDGMKEIVGLLHRTLEVEWREEHEDALLHEVLLCLKALCTTALALKHLDNIQSTLFPALIHMLFDEEKKGPSEFTTRNIVTSLLFTYIKSASLAERSRRAQVLLSYLRDPEPKEEERPVGFVLDMRRDRPYRVWCKEVVNVTKEVFWIFLHNLNVVTYPSISNEEYCDAHYAYLTKHFPQEQPPVAAAPYVGGVEWDATNYLASHLDLVNGILSSLETKAQRNTLREQLRISGWERCMGATLRQCTEKFYGNVHAGLRSWVAAAFEDGWDVRDVRCGPPVETKSPSRKSPAKQKKVEEVPQIEMPKLDFGLDKKAETSNDLWVL